MAAYSNGVAFLADSFSDSAKRKIELASFSVIFISRVSDGAGFMFSLSLTYELDSLSTSAFLYTVYSLSSSSSAGLGWV